MELNDYLQLSISSKIISKSVFFKAMFSWTTTLSQTIQNVHDVENDTRAVKLHVLSFRICQISQLK